MMASWPIRSTRRSRAGRDESRRIELEDVTGDVRAAIARIERGDRGERSVSCCERFVERFRSDAQARNDADAGHGQWGGNDPSPFGSVQLP